VDQSVPTPGGEEVHLEIIEWSEIDCQDLLVMSLDLKLLLEVGGGIHTQYTLLVTASYEVAILRHPDAFHLEIVRMAVSAALKMGEVMILHVDDLRQVAAVDISSESYSCRGIQ
jgi:hypothetical protein